MSITSVRDSISEIAPAARAPGFAAALRQELAPTLKLAAPVVAGELAAMLMGIVDTFMVAPLGKEALGGVSIANILFCNVVVFGMGLLYGLDPLVSQAFGAGKLAEAHRTLVQSLYLMFASLPALVAAVLIVFLWLPTFGVRPDVLKPASEYLYAVYWSMIPWLLFTALRRYLQGLHIVVPVMAALVSANVLNVGANYVLIYGVGGWAGMGVEGAAWATLISRGYMALALVAYIIWRERRMPTGLFATSLRIAWGRTFELLRLGLPVATQFALEVGVFTIATVLAGKLDASALAAHHIVLQVASVTFMVPLGVSAAAAVRVGQAIGGQDPAGAHQRGWAAICVGGGFMACCGLAMPLLREPLLTAFTTDPSVLIVGRQLMLAAAVFQLFDGLQVVASGALRGAGNTRLALICNLVGHWAIGLPIGVALCFSAGWGVLGLWVGLSTGLIAVGATLLAVWARGVGLDLTAVRSSNPQVLA